MELEYETTLPNTDLDVVCVFDYTLYDPGKVSGPPEDCYPPEGGEAEVTQVLVGNEDIFSCLSSVTVDALMYRCETWARERQAAGEL